MNIQCAYDEIVPLANLVENPRNPNKHPDRQIELLAKIIAFQGQRSPIIVSTRSKFIVKGHARLKALAKLGWESAAVDFQDYESEAQEFADMVADNKIAEFAEHDDALMIDVIKELQIDDFEVLGLNDFSFLTNFASEASEEVDIAAANASKKYLVEVTLPNEMEQRDLFDDLTSKGYQAIIRG